VLREGEIHSFLRQKGGKNNFLIRGGEHFIRKRGWASGCSLGIKGKRKGKRKGLTSSYILQPWEKRGSETKKFPPASKVGLGKKGGVCF